MIKIITLVVISLSVTLSSFCQINNPSYLKKDVEECDIIKVEKNSNNTVVYFKYTNKHDASYGPWVRIDKDFFIRDKRTNKKYPLIKANNIPITPDKHYFKYKGQVLEFNLIFKALPLTVNEIDVIEDENGRAFNFYGVSLNNKTFGSMALKSNGKMRSTPDVLSDVLCMIPAGKEVRIIGNDGGYYEVEYNGKHGYISSIYFESSGIQSSNKPVQNKSTNQNCNEIKYIKGKNYTSKPSLSRRLSGCNKIYVPVPNSSSFAWQGFISYLRGLGLDVVTIQKQFEKKTVDLGTVIGVYTIYQGSDFVKNDNANNLGAVLNTLNAASTHAGSRNTAKITFVDFNNSYTWDYEINIPNSYEKYKRILKNEICYSVTKNPSAKVVLPKRISCWNERKIKQFYSNNGVDSFEGIYENTVSSSGNEAKYKVAVKKISGKHHLIYLSGAINPQEWIEGEVKAVLEKTSTHGFFKAKWYMANKTENNDFYISFENGLMNVLNPEDDKNMYVKLYPSVGDNIDQYSNLPSSGTGFALTKNGLIVTNNHVIRGAKKINVRGVGGNFNRTYSARVVTTDKKNDLAIIKIDDYSFNSLGRIPYSIKMSNSSVGENIFVLGYPLRATMGDEIKLTDGIISSRSGFQGDITSYQISAPVQPGNSGGPLFDKKGNIVGIINAKHTGAENASYAVKVSYLLNLVNSLEYPPQLPSVNLISNKPLTNQVSMVKNFVYIIEAIPE
ncbi:MULTISPECIES: trypsin-like peptidase domain-containing protein [unclassified Carboxylicivirga]|uniref:trypsin-like peptidase domain-containing protein n=1 Tax=Carboxylicivirga TaxID=1628153 RepID=UPI003D34741E